MAADERLEFFEKRIRPVLVAHCYACHSADAKELQGELRLDLRAGWQAGGESGEPAVIPGKPDASLLLRAMRHADDVSAMPPRQPRLPDTVLEDFAQWIRMGAVDPRDGAVQRRDRATEWEVSFRERSNWWSLKELTSPPPPAVQQTSWPRNEIDRFVLARLEERGLTPSTPADPKTLLRRLSFALTGLPPSRDLLEDFSESQPPEAFDHWVDRLLNSPQFGERWARHWMDVVHYSDTHGYEWDVPVKNAWRYRDYLIQAMNDDLPYSRFVLEHLAGDLVEPRLDPASGVNLSLIGPLALRLGERRHGDSAAAEGVTQEAVANMIDTLGKAFLGTTLACAQCHDHKLDAVSQADYYSLAGMLMSTRFSARPIDGIDPTVSGGTVSGGTVSAPNVATIDQLRRLKQQMRDELSRLWLQSLDSTDASGVAGKIRAIPADEKPATTFPATLVEYWKRSLQSPSMEGDFHQQQTQRREANARQLTLLADFTREGGEGGWRWDGSGMRHGLTQSGDLVVALEGDSALQHLLPAGRFSHVWSQRLAGSLQSPAFDASNPATISLELVSGKFASMVFIVDRALNSERLQFPHRPSLGWQTLTAGNFDTLEGTIDKAPRRVYLELATKSLNNYFPPRVGYGGLSEAELNDPRSWFGVTRVYQHAPGQGPQDELERFVPLFGPLQSEADWARRLTLLLRDAVLRWSQGTSGDEDVRLLNDALSSQLLPNQTTASVALERIVRDYRETEQRLVPDRTVGSVAEWDEGRNERIGLRGSYTDLGEEVERARLRILGEASERRTSLSSGRLEWARQVTDPRNPLLARVYVNRVWHYLFGEGLVRTPDDFGHLGDVPSHPELLDYLAARFIADGWSTKKLIRLLVSSATWRQSNAASAEGREVDPENRLWHHMPLRRLEAEAIRDSLLTVSGRLDRQLYGPPIEPHRTAEDGQKRLFRGPLDGGGRRSVYLEMTLMEPPRFLALFNQPIPKQTVGRRDVTNVPDQALALLNDPFVTTLAEHWSRQLVRDDSRTVEERAARMLELALVRSPTDAETARLADLVRTSGRLRGASADELLRFPAVWQDAAHALFNLKEFIYVP